MKIPIAPLDRPEQSRRLVPACWSPNMIRYRQEGRQKQWFVCRNVVQVDDGRSFPGPGRHLHACRRQGGSRDRFVRLCGLRDACRSRGPPPRISTASKLNPVVGQEVARRRVALPVNVIVWSAWRRRRRSACTTMASLPSGDGGLFGGSLLHRHIRTTLMRRAVFCHEFPEKGVPFLLHVALGLTLAYRGRQ